MAICDECGKEMTTGVGCSMRTIMLEGASFPRLAHGTETFALASVGRCSDCGVTLGFHHPGCAREQCPRCAEQLFCCDCEKDDGDYGDEDDDGAD